MTMLARLKPYNERKGHKTRVYMIDGARFLEERGWYEVTDGMADQLRDLHQEHYDLESPMLFDVCTVAEAEKLEEQEAKIAETTPRASARRPAAVVSTRHSMPSRTLPQETGDNMSSDAQRTPRLEASETKPDGTIVRPAGAEVRDDGSSRRSDGVEIKRDGTQVKEDGTEIKPGEKDDQRVDGSVERPVPVKGDDDGDDDDDKDDEGRALEVGRVRGEPKPRIQPTQQPSQHPQQRKK